ncbi:UNVERIFIED_CONTAM: hypothetical protein FKN15_024708 [Acipenser sinensis]
MSSFHRCVTCQAKLPASDPHDDCVACLGPEHAASALADKAYCHLCAGFQTPESKEGALQEPILPAYSWSEVPSKSARERSCSPSFRGARPRRESRSRSRSPRRRRHSRSPRRGRQHQDRFGVAELTSKMSQFMEVMMGQQSLLMTLANVAPRVPEQLAGPIANQPVAPPPLAHGGEHRGRGYQVVTSGQHDGRSSSRPNSSSIPVGRAQASSSGQGNFSSHPDLPPFFMSGNSLLWGSGNLISGSETVAGGAGLLTFPPFFVAGSSPPWGSGHNTSCCHTGLAATPGEAGPLVTPGETGPSATPGEAGPSATPGEAGPSVTPGEAKDTATPGDAEQQAAPGDAEQQAGPGDTEQQVGPGDAEQQAAPGDAEQQAGPGDTEQQVGPGDAEQQAGPGDAEQQAGPGDTEQQVGPGDAEQQAAPGDPDVASLSRVGMASLSGARQTSPGGARHAPPGGARQDSGGPSEGDGGSGPSEGDCRRGARTSGGAGVGPLLSRCDSAIFPLALLSSPCKGGC